MFHVFFFICIRLIDCAGDFQWATLKSICCLFTFFSYPMIFMTFGVAKIAMWSRSNNYNSCDSLSRYFFWLGWACLWLFFRHFICCFWKITEPYQTNSIIIRVTFSYEKILQIIFSSTSSSSWITFVLICFSSMQHNNAYFRQINVFVRFRKEMLLY